MKKINKTPENTMITLSELRDRGWTAKMIKDYGLQPDELKDNPHYLCAAPMKLYDLRRIKRIESRAWFKKRYAESLPRRAAAQKAAETKYNKMMAFIESIPITIPDWPKEEAFTKAVKHYNELWVYERGWEDKYIPNYRCLDRNTLERITTNMFRHAQTDYDNILFKCYGKVGVSAAHDYLQKKINDLVHQKYFSTKTES